MRAVAQLQSGMATSDARPHASVPASHEPFSRSVYGGNRSSMHPHQEYGGWRQDLKVVARDEVAVAVADRVVVTDRVGDAESTGSAEGHRQIRSKGSGDVHEEGCG